MKLFYVFDYFFASASIMQYHIKYAFVTIRESDFHFMHRLKSSLAYWLVVLTLLVSCGASTSSDQPAPTTARTAIPATPTIENPTATLQSTAIPPTEIATTTVVKDVTISFAAYDEDKDTYTTLAKQFTESHPNIHVAIVSFDSALSTGKPNSDGHAPEDSANFQLRRLVSAADAIPGSNLFINTTIGTPIILDLKPYMDADTNFDKNDYYAGVLDRYTVNGSIYMLPRNINIPLLNYNQDLFTKANIPSPATDWTYADVLATAEKLTLKENNTITRYGLYDTSYYGVYDTTFVYLLKEAGVDVYSLTKSELDANAPKIVSALKKYADLVNRGVIYAQPMADRPVAGQGAEASPGVPSDPDQMILAGKIAIWRDDTLQVLRKPVNPAPSFTIGQAVQPIFKIHSDPESSGYMISGGTKNPAETWTFIEWLSRQPMTKPLRSYSQGYSNTRKSLDALQPAVSGVGKLYQSAYEYTVANLPPITTPAYDVGKEFPLLETILRSPDMLFSNPSLTAEEIVNQSIQLIQSDGEHELHFGSTPTPDISPITVATPVK
jgi:ABC-type glycerol-3-phosphate transport system substrate-binding protein